MSFDVQAGTAACFYRSRREWYSADVCLCALRDCPLAIYLDHGRRAATAARWRPAEPKYYTGANVNMSRRLRRVATMALNIILSPAVKPQNDLLVNITLLGIWRFCRRR